MNEKNYFSLQVIKLEVICYNSILINIEIGILKQGGVIIIKRIMNQKNMKLIEIGNRL